MAKVDAELSTATQREGADAAEVLARYTGRPVPESPGSSPFLIQFYRSAVCKKWLMAVSGIVLMGYVLAHMIGNLKVFLGKGEINAYAEWLRELGEPAAPRTVVLWILRTLIITAFFVHIVAAAQLTRINLKARPVRYQSPRDYAAANFASRSMRWTGVIVGLFVIFHLFDLTWGNANPNFVRGDPYDNLFATFDAFPSRSCTSSPTSRSACTCSTGCGACSRAWAGTVRASTSGAGTSRPDSWG